MARKAFSASPRDMSPRNDITNTASTTMSGVCLSNIPLSETRFIMVLTLRGHLWIFLCSSQGRRFNPMSHREIIDDLLDERGRTYAQEAGIGLKDTPAPLYQLLVLANLLSTRISAGIAVATARELTDSRFSTPEKMRAATWQQRVNALGRGGDRRYDERTSTMLGDGAAGSAARCAGVSRAIGRSWAAPPSSSTVTPGT